MKCFPVSITSESAYVNVIIFFSFPALLNVILVFVPCKTDGCGMTDNISFPYNGYLFGKKRILSFHHYQPDVVIIPCHLESKSFCAFSFIGTFAL